MEHSEHFEIACCVTVFAAILCLLFAAPHVAFAKGVDCDEVKGLAAMMSARGLGDLEGSELLLDRHGQASYLIGYASDGYMIIDRGTLAFMEQGGGRGPYSSDASKKYYGGALCYAEERDGALVDVRTGEALESTPYCPAAEEIVRRGTGTQRDGDGGASDREEKARDAAVVAGGMLVSQAYIGSPATGPSDGETATVIQVASQLALQATKPDDIPEALDIAHKANPDVIAWLYVPGTSVSTPVAWRAGDESRYLDHDASGQGSPIGCAFVGGASAADFSDPVTPVYGHSFSAGPLAFTSLHAFEDVSFFASHDRAYVYLPGKRLRYRMVGAYLYTDKGIGELDHSDPEALSAYFSQLSDEDPSTFMGYKRRVELDPGSDRVLQLSTCTVPACESLRFVVTCVLAGEEEL